MFTPKQKLYYLSRYKNAYWSFVYKQLIKLKQLSSINEQADFDYSGVVEASINQTLSPYGANMTQVLKPDEASSMNIKNFFAYYESNEPDENKENESEPKLRGAQFEYDSLIQTGLLNLILSDVRSSSEEHDSTCSVEGLNEALGLFNQMNKSLGDVSKEQLGNYQLTVIIFYGLRLFIH
jgi:hypothetical protein